MTGRRFSPCPSISAAAAGKREKYRLPTRQQLGTVRDLALFDANQELRPTAVRYTRMIPRAAWAKMMPSAPQLRPTGLVASQNRDRCAAAHGNSFQLLVLRVERQRLPIRRKCGTSNTADTGLDSRDRPSLVLGH